MKLYSPKDNYKTSRLLAVAKHLGVNIQHIQTDYEATKQAQFAKQYPQSMLPAVYHNGRYVFGVSAITRLISQNEAEDLLKWASTDDWIDFTDYEVDRFASALLLIDLGYVDYDQAKAQQLQQKMIQVLAKANIRLNHCRFLTGQSLSVADIVLCSSLAFCFKYRLKEEAKKSLQNVTRWMAEVSQSSVFQQSFSWLNNIQSRLAKHLNQ